MALPQSSIIELRGVTRFSPRDETRLESAVREVDLQVAGSGMLWLGGPAGGGKELLFRLLNLAVTPESGEVCINGKSCWTLEKQAASELRMRKFGFVSAAPFLIPTFTAIENIAVPMLKVSRMSMEEAQARIADLLNFAGLVGQEEKPVSELSSLDQARLALARALANAPLAIFVEDLDEMVTPDEAGELVALLRRCGETRGVAVIALEGAVIRALPEERRLEMVDGRIERDSAVFGSTVSPERT